MTETVFRVECIEHAFELLLEFDHVADCDVAHRYGVCGYLAEGLDCMDEATKYFLLASKAFENFPTPIQFNPKSHYNLAAHYALKAGKKKRARKLARLYLSEDFPEKDRKLLANEFDLEGLL